MKGLTSIMLIFFFNGLAFGGLGLAAFLQLRQGSDLPLGRHLKWLAAFGFSCGLTNWIDMFLTSGGTDEYIQYINHIENDSPTPDRMVFAEIWLGITERYPFACLDSIHSRSPYRSTGVCHHLCHNHFYHSFTDRNPDRHLVTLSSLFTREYPGWDRFHAPMEHTT